MDEPKEQFSEEGAAIVRPPVRKRTRKRSIIIFTVVSLLNIGLLTLLWTQLLTPASTSTSQGTAATTDVLIGTTAPNFILPDLKSSNGTQISLADFKGKPMVINFWSSTCVPCQDEAPLLETQWQRVKGQGVIFVGIDVEDTQNDGLSFIHQHGATYNNVIDTKGDTLVNYGVTYTPETIFINREGKVVSAVRMEITSQQLQAGLQAIMR
ncbi:MAG: TlpA disulfide reductase family protein [Ktedonobacteraceae bacterium]